MRKNKILMRLISDLHGGSRYALCPKGFILDEGQEEEVKIRLSKGQKWLWTQWKKYADLHRNPDYIVNTGDSIDGINWKGRGIGVITTNIDDQIKMSTEAIKLLMGKNTNYLACQGTHYHNSKSRESEWQIARNLKGKYQPDWLIDIGKRIFSFAHASWGGWITVQRGIEREIEMAQKLMGKGKIPIGKFFMARGHIHRMRRGSEFDDFEGVFNGCWKLVSPYSRSKQPLIFRDLDVGAIDLFLYDDGTIKLEPFRPHIPYQYLGVVDMKAEFKAQRTHKQLAKKPYLNKRRKEWNKG